MTQILLLGTFHFADDPIDICSDSVQNELKNMVDKFKKFDPDAVAVEFCVREQKAVSDSYVKLSVEDFRNYEKMHNETLGDIFLWGRNRKIIYKSESVQIGYRLGKLLNLPDIYAIDEDLELDDNSAEIIINELGDEGQRLISALQIPETSITEKYKIYNSEKRSKINHRFYIRANAVNRNGDYVGANFFTKWYERNLKIFSNLQKLAENHERIFVIYGAGHLQILRDLINADDRLKSVDVNDYL